MPCGGRADENAADATPSPAGATSEAIGQAATHPAAAGAAQGSGRRHAPGDELPRDENAAQQRLPECEMPIVGQRRHAVAGAHLQIELHVAGVVVGQDVGRRVDPQRRQRLAGPAELGERGSCALEDRRVRVFGMPEGPLSAIVRVVRPRRLAFGQPGVQFVKENRLDEQRQSGQIAAQACIAAGHAGLPCLAHRFWLRRHPGDVRVARRRAPSQVDGQPVVTLFRFVVAAQVEIAEDVRQGQRVDFSVLQQALQVLLASAERDRAALAMYPCLQRVGESGVVFDDQQTHVAPDRLAGGGGFAVGKVRRRRFFGRRRVGELAGRRLPEKDLFVVLGEFGQPQAFVTGRWRAFILDGLPASFFPVPQCVDDRNVEPAVFMIDRLHAGLDPVVEAEEIRQRCAVGVAVVGQRVRHLPGVQPGVGEQPVEQDDGVPVVRETDHRAGDGQTGQRMRVFPGVGGRIGPDRRGVGRLGRVGARAPVIVDEQRNGIAQAVCFVRRPAVGRQVIGMHLDSRSDRVRRLARLGFQPAIGENLAHPRLQIACGQ